MPYTPRGLLYKLLYRLRRASWFVFRTHLYGALCLTECAGRVLLVRNTYGSMKWTLPGGGIKKGERPAEAVRREVREETGVAVDQVSELGCLIGTEHYERDTVVCFYAAVGSLEMKIDRGEIYEAGWFAWERLPEPLSSDAKRVIELFRQSRMSEG